MSIQQGFKAHRGTACPLDQANIDTDQIIPKQFLTGVTRTGYGKHLLHDWRYLDLHEQEPNPDFVLNQARYQNASILLTRENFGCGSSREHAPWALADYGFKVIIATSFADIFYGNCINNQLLPVALDSGVMDELFDCVTTNPETLITVDLPSQTVAVNDRQWPFTIADHHKDNLIKGLDAIGQTLEKAVAIEKFEQSQPQWL
ncbi:3-isopropylmalate dehydratase small subunit [Salinimonas chungwhensis]|uniref:3-isopropylmalate dehydratase small subunit n=1 Tax=Salinimonas chungwhensis TaxID=265425 RepID=UPI0003651ED0|nr:3-isopropylmalate dehydratase small subunit [Salinimonas chungwhensis]